MIDFDLKATEKSLFQFVSNVSNRVMTSDFSKLAEISKTFIEAKYRSSMIFAVGNGGSASTAGHLVNDLIKGCRVYNRNGFRALCLNDLTAPVTCLANDFSYDVTYSMLLGTLGNPGDIVTVFSGSGNSPSTLNILKQAREMGIITVGFGGRDGGQMKELCDICLIAPTDSMEKLEDMHMMYCHSLVCITRQLLKEIWDIEILKYPNPNISFKFAEFDFSEDNNILSELLPRQIEPMIEALKLKGVVSNIVSDLSKRSRSGYIEQNIDSDAKLISKQLILFSDIPANIRYAENSGIYTIGIALDTNRRTGISETKRDILIKSGACAIVPDLSNTNGLIKFLFGAYDFKKIQIGNSI